MGTWATHPVNDLFAVRRTGKACRAGRFLHLPVKVAASTGRDATRLCQSSLATRSILEGQRGLGSVLDYQCLMNYEGASRR